jgi:hypothetical protein
LFEVWCCSFPAFAKPFPLSVYFASLIFAKSALEEVIDDELVWQEVKNLPVDAALIAKMTAEIEGIKAKYRKGNPCKQYVLRASEAGWYFCEHTQKIWLEEGEIWKIGKTCLSEKGRYSKGSHDKRLIFAEQFSGTAEQCLIVEKVKLFAYPLFPENINRKNPLLLPPGNKIRR